MTISPPPKKLDVLVIEDNPIDFALIEYHLGKSDMAFRPVRIDRLDDLKDAILFKEWDLVLTDFSVPGLDFDECLAFIRANRPELPIILVSGSVGEERAVELLKKGIWDFVLKDRPARLLTSIERGLNDAAALKIRQAAERSLRQAAAVFLNTREGVVVADIEGSIQTVNPAFCGMTGYDEQELIGRNMRLIQSGRHSPEFYRDIRLSVETAGFWQGEIWNRRKNGEIFPTWLTINRIKDEDGLPVSNVGTYTDISRIKRSEAQLEHLAHHDPLTDLPNRLLLVSRLEHAIERAKRDGGRGAVLLLDLDRFKTINDSLGHPMGDEVLRTVAERHRSCLHEADTLARLGGDEFAVLLEGLSTQESVANIAQMMIEETAKPISLSTRQEVYVGGSIGISLFPEDGETASQILKNADAALYQAKSAGRNTYRYYTESLTRAAQIRLDLESRLRRALARGEFVLHYQPLVAIKDRRIKGVEALVRWQSPDKGMVSPADFIPIAEETGLILPLGHWVLATAARQMTSWLKDGFKLDVMAVNLSPLQFREPDLMAHIRDVLDESGLDPGHLELEITEGALMDQGQEALSRLAGLKDLGLSLAIDDFGTGYSSLAYLKRFPIDKLKVDQSFVRDIPEDPADMEIAAAIIGLARTLRLEVLAEGIETEAQLSFLSQQGCHTGQGYLFSRPLPADRLALTLKGN